MTEIIRPHSHVAPLLTPARAKELGLTVSGRPRRNEEYDIQCAFISWLDTEGIARWPELVFAYAIPNERRSVGDARKRWREGARSGPADWCFPLPRGTWTSLRLEFKTKAGGLSPTQRAWMDGMRHGGCHTMVVRDSDDAISVLMGYMGYPAAYNEARVREHAQTLLAARADAAAKRKRRRYK